MKEQFIKEASKHIKREGVKELLEYLNSTDFYKAPASSKFHGAVVGGLVLHSLSVFDIATSLNDLMELNLPMESIAITTLFHDLCKTNFYVLDDEEPSQAQLNFAQSLCEEAGIKMPPKSERTKAYMSIIIDALKNRKKIPPYKPSYKVVDTFPMGHGEKSVYLINKFMKLTDEEALAIRWHLGTSDPGVSFGYPSGLPQKQSFVNSKLVALVYTADIAASYLLDTW